MSSIHHLSTAAKNAASPPGTTPLPERAALLKAYVTAVVQGEKLSAELRELPTGSPRRGELMNIQAGVRTRAAGLQLLLERQGLITEAERQVRLTLRTSAGSKSAKAPAVAQARARRTLDDLRQAYLTEAPETLMQSAKDALNEGAQTATREIPFGAPAHEKPTPLAKPDVWSSRTNDISALVSTWAPMPAFKPGAEPTLGALARGVADAGFAMGVTAAAHALALSVFQMGNSPLTLLSKALFPDRKAEVLTW